VGGEADNLGTAVGDVGDAFDVAHGLRVIDEFDH